MALNVHLEDYSKTLDSKEQLAVAEFAEALTIIPKVLATNAAQDANELVSKLRVLHAKAQSEQGIMIILYSDDKGYRFSGLDLLNGVVR